MFWYKPGMFADFFPVFVEGKPMQTQNGKQNPKGTKSTQREKQEERGRKCGGTAKKRTAPGARNAPSQAELNNKIPQARLNANFEPHD